MEARGQPQLSFLKNNIFWFFKVFTFQKHSLMHGRICMDVTRQFTRVGPLPLSWDQRPNSGCQTGTASAFASTSPSRDLIGHIFSFIPLRQNLSGLKLVEPARLQVSLPASQWTPENKSASASSEVEFQVCPYHTWFYLGKFRGHQTQVFTFACVNCTLKTLFNHPRSRIHFLMKQTCKKAYLCSFPDVSAKIDTLP